MEELNKTQLVLLMLFVSFVTSIATGVVTVTLLEQAPKSVTQQINRVVERTVEKIVPGPGETKTINTTTQVVVSEDDLIIRAVGKTTPALVRIRVTTMVESQTTATSTAVNNLAALSALDEPTLVPVDTYLTGAVVAESGRIITSPSGLFAASSVDKEYPVLLYGTSAERKARLIYVSEEQNLAVLDLLPLKGDTKFPSMTFPVNPLALGQTLVLLDFTSEAGPSVSVGRITELRQGTASSSPVVSTNIDTTSRILGDPLIDTNGSFAGFVKRGGKVTPFDGIKAALNKGFSAPVDKSSKGQ